MMIIMMRSENKDDYMYEITENTIIIFIYYQM